MYKTRKRPNVDLARDLEETGDQIIRFWDAQKAFTSRPVPMSTGELGRIEMVMRSDFQSDCQREAMNRFGGRLIQLYDECTEVGIVTDATDRPWFFGPTGAHFPEVAHQLRGIAGRLTQKSDQSREGCP
jgi:hypothetical protein